MKKLLHADAGDRLVDWMDLYEETIDTVHTPLTREQHEEAQRTCACIEEYRRGRATSRTVGRIRERRSALDVMRENFPEEYSEVAHLSRNDMLRHWDQLIDENSKLARALARYHWLLDKAKWELEIPRPDWDVPTIALLESEVEQYLERLLAAAKEEFGDESPESFDGE